MPTSTQVSHRHVIAVCTSTSMTDRYTDQDLYPVGSSEWLGVRGMAIGLATLRLDGWASIAASCAYFPPLLVAHVYVHARLSQALTDEHARTNCR